MIELKYTPEEAARKAEELIAQRKEEKRERKRTKNRNWYSRNREEVLSYAKTYYESNREKILASHREAYIQDSSRQKEYGKRRRQNPEIRERQRQLHKQWLVNNADSYREYLASDHRKKMMRGNHVKRTYGLTLDQWRAAFAAQGYRCANDGCRTDDPGDPKGWHTDHCHETGKFRSILCRACNHALGHSKESPARLRGLADYKEKHNGSKRREARPELTPDAFSDQETRSRLQCEAVGSP